MFFFRHPYAHSKVGGLTLKIELNSGHANRQKMSRSFLDKMIARQKKLVGAMRFF